MLRTASSQAWLIGFLATVASFCALHAFGEQSYSVVAQSTKATAATGRKPIAQRIAASNQPVRPRPGAACSEKGCPTPGSTAAISAVDAAPAPEPAALPEPAAADEVEAAVVDAEPRPVGVAKQPKMALGSPQPEPIRQSLLDRVKSALVGQLKTRRTPAKLAIPSAAAAMPPMPKPVPMPEEMADVLTDEEPREMPEFAAVDDADSDAAMESDAGDGQPVHLAEVAEVATIPRVIIQSDDTPRESDLADAAAGATIVNAPARLEFDVRESRSLVSEGEQVIMRIAVRNVGGETAENVHATLFFADGMEPVRAIGHTAEVFPGEVRFEQVPRIDPGKSIDLLVTAIGTRPGQVVYRGEVKCRQIPGRIAQEGAVTVRPRKPY